MEKYYKKIPAESEADNFRKRKLLYLLIFSILINLQLTNAQYTSALIPDFRVNDDIGTTMQSSPKIGVDGNGNFIITWNDQRNTSIGLPFQVYCQRFAFDGTRLGINFRIGHDTSGGGFITVLNDGRFIAAWHGNVNGENDIYVQRFFANGTQNGNPVKVNDTNVAGAIASLGDIDADSLGNFVVVWQDYRGGVAWQPDVYGQRFDLAGNRIGNNFKINDNTNQSTQAGPQIAINKDGSFVICWLDDRSITTADIYMQRYDRFGNTIGVNQRVDDDINNSRQGGCNIASDGRGYFVIAFDDYREIYNTPHLYYQVYDTLGNKVGTNRKADENFGQIGAGAPKVYMQVNGKFVIGWSDDRYNSHIPFAQRFNKDGSKIGVNFRIPELNSSINYGLGSIFLYSDRIYTTWSDTRNSNYDIFANVKSFINPDSILSNINAQNQIPAWFKLYPVYPNPFNPTLNIKYSISKLSFVQIKIYDVLGNEIESLVEKNQSAGLYETRWDGSSYSSGIYLIKIITNNGFKKITKAVLLK